MRGGKRFNKAHLSISKSMKHYKRFRIIETIVKNKSTFVIQWNDRWFFGLWGFWHDKMICDNLDECKEMIHRFVSYIDRNE